MNIPPVEYKERQEKFRKEAEERGFEGLLVWSRSGSNLDRYADVFYLANHYSHFPYLPDNPPSWTGKGHSAVVLPVEGDPVLLVDAPFYRDDLVMIDDQRVGEDLLELAVETMKEKKLLKGKVGLVGSDVLPFSFYGKLAKGLPRIRFVVADDISENLRMIKSENEIGIIKKSCEIAVAALRKGLEAVAPRTTEAEIVSVIARDLIMNGVAIYDIIPAAGPHSGVYCYSRLPAFDYERKMEEGDMFHVDIFGAYQGYQFDFGRTVVVGREPDKEQTELMNAVEGSVNEVIKAIKPGVTAGEAGQIGYEYLEKTGFIKISDVGHGGKSSGFPSFGHGLGLQFGRPYLMKRDRTRLRPGMYLAVEKTIGKPGVGGAMLEHDVVVTDAGVEVLTRSI